MPGKLGFVTQKFRSQSVPNDLDIKKPIINQTQIVTKDEEDTMNQNETDSSWFKTWPDKNYDKLDTTSNDSTSPVDEENKTLVEHVPSSNVTSNDEYEPRKNSIPLSTLLESIPLAYSPVTKQLHFFKKKEEDDTVCVKLMEESQNCDDKPDPDTESKKYDKYNEGSTSVNGCELKTEASSYSSIVSSLSSSDLSPNNDDNLSTYQLDDDVSIVSQSSYDTISVCGENSKFFKQPDINVQGCEEKRKGLTGFFSRNVFAWKSNTSLTPSLTQGWKLFSKNSSTSSQDQFRSDLSSDGSFKGSQQSVTESPSNSKKYEDVVASSSALILHNRPANLPAKSHDEELKHRLEYQQMVEAARRKELKETKLKKKQLQQQLKQEEQLSNASRTWNNEILPKWELMKCSKKCRELWWQGIPPCVRGKVWKLAINNELHITKQLYDICVARALERLKTVDNNTDVDEVDGNNKESSVELIQLDISRTFPHLCIFQKGGPYYDILHSLLGAYVCYRPDVGYVQGMSFIAAILILNLEAPDAFICFSNLLNRPCHMAFFSLNQAQMNAYYETYNDLFRENLPRLQQHFTDSSLTPDLYLLDWLYTVFSKAMPLDIACRVWDVFLRDGEEFLIRAALGVLHLHQDTLMKLDFITGAQFLTKLPEDLSSDKLFKSIEVIKMNVGKNKFNDVLSYNIEKLTNR